MHNIATTDFVKAQQLAFEDVWAIKQEGNLGYDTSEWLNTELKRYRAQLSEK